MLNRIINEEIGFLKPLVLHLPKFEGCKDTTCERGPQASGVAVKLGCKLYQSPM